MVLLKITILGSGTSTGVPIIGCKCAVCMNSDPSYHRLRSSILIEEEHSKTTIVVDTTPDFRTQMLRAKVDRLDAVLYTHTHADHCHGFDDLRAFYFFRKAPIPCFLDPIHANELKARFEYAFVDSGYLGTVPQVCIKEIDSNPFAIGPLEIEAIWLPHGSVTSLAYRFGRFAYATDFKYFPPQAIEKWRGKVNTMVASGLHFKPHNTHSTIDETISLFAALGVEKGYITHLSHNVDHKRDAQHLPENVFFAYDQMVISVTT